MAGFIPQSVPLETVWCLDWPCNMASLPCFDPWQVFDWVHAIFGFFELFGIDLEPLWGANWPDPHSNRLLLLSDPCGRGAPRCSDLNLA